MRHPALMAALALLFAATAARAEDWHDNIDLPFIDDPAVVGVWQSVDFVKTPEQFQPGGATDHEWESWTKGYRLHHGGDHTASRYKIKRIGGIEYMFYEWKSGDYTIRHQKPRYYVLKRASATATTTESAERSPEGSVPKCGTDEVWQSGACVSCVPHAHPDEGGTSCSCERGYRMNQMGNLCYED